MESLIKLAVEVIKIVKDPVLLFIIVALVYLLWHKERCVTKELEKMSERLTREMSCVTKILSKQVTLLEVTIFGHGKENRK